MQQAQLPFATVVIHAQVPDVPVVATPALKNYWEKRCFSQSLKI